MKNIVDYYLDYGDRLQRQNQARENLRRSKIFDQYYPENLQSQIDAQQAAQRLRNAQTARELLFNSHPELMAGRLGQEEFLKNYAGETSPVAHYINQLQQSRLQPTPSHDPLAKTKALINLYRMSPDGSQEKQLAASMLNRMASTSQGATLTTPSGETITLGGSQAPSLFPVQQSSQNEGQKAVIGTAAAPMARGHAGITITEGGETHSVPTTTNLSSLQKRALSLQSILNDLPYITDAAQYNLPFGLGKASEKVNAVLANIFPDTRAASNFRNFQNSKAVLAKTIDALSSFFNVPRTNEGLEMIAQYIAPHSGDSKNAYNERLNRILVPSLQKNYENIRDSLMRGIKLNIPKIMNEHNKEFIRVRNIRTGRTGRVKTSNIHKLLEQGNWVVAHEK